MSKHNWIEPVPMPQNTMRVGLTLYTAVCECGWKSDAQTTWDARRALNKHANDCDTALYALLSEDQEAVK